VPSADAQIFACAESAGSDVCLKGVNNRAFPVGLELSAKPSAVTSPAWPTSLVEMLNTALTRTLNSDRTIALPPFGEVDLTYGLPSRGWRHARSGYSGVTGRGARCGVTSIASCLPGRS